VETDGTHTANITLLGNYVTGNFHLTSDGLGGALVLDPPVDGRSSSTSTSQANGTSDVTLLGQCIAGTSTSNGGPFPPQGNGLIRQRSVRPTTTRSWSHAIRDGCLLREP
jgi:hypothetical protein